MTPAEVLRAMAAEHCQPWCAEPLHEAHQREALQAGADALERLGHVEAAARVYLAAVSSHAEHAVAESWLRELLGEAVSHG